MLYDDLTAAVLPPSNTNQPGLKFRQGVIEQFNQATGENVVNVGGAQLVNLPLMNISDALNYGPGAVVSILTSGGQMFIMGRIVSPGSAAAQSALSGVFSPFKTASDFTSGTRNNADFGDLSGTNIGPEVTVNVRQSGRVLCLWSADFGQSVEWRRVNTGGISVALSGSNVLAASGNWSLGQFLEFVPSPSAPEYALAAGGAQGAMMHVFEGLNPGNTTFTMKYRTRTAPGNVTFTARQIAAWPL